MLENIVFEIQELSRLDATAILSDPDTTGARVIEPTYDPARHNELLTVGIIGGSAILLAAAGYFFGKRKTETLTIDSDAIMPDGTRKRLSLKFSKKDISPIKVQLDKQLLDALGL